MRFTHYTSLLLTAAIAASFLSGCGGGSGAAPPGGNVVLAPVTTLAPVSTLAAGVTQTAQPEVDQYMQGQLVEQRIPGITLVVVRDGTVVYGPVGRSNSPTFGHLKFPHPVTA